MTANELRSELEELFFALKKGKITPAVAAEMNGAAANIIGLTRLEMNFQKDNELGEDRPTIGLLEDPRHKARKTK